MIVGVGCDIVALPRVARLLGAYPQKLPRRLLRESERALFAKAAKPCEFLAGRVAAKEALAKALGLGMRAPLHWQRVAVERGEGGKPVFVFDSAAREYLAKQKIAACHLSISHDGDYAAATVIAECQNP